MFGFKKRHSGEDQPNRTTDIERACSATWLEFAASAAVSCETTIVLRANEDPKEAVHYALCAKKRDHVADMVKQMVAHKVPLTDEEIGELTHRIQTRAVERIEEVFPELMVARILVADPSYYVRPGLEPLFTAFNPDTLTGR